VIVIYNTEVFEFSDPQGAKEAWLSFKDSLEAGGGSDVRLFRNVDNPNQVLATMWWESTEACRSWGPAHEADVMEKLGPFTRSMDPEFLWAEF